MQLIEHMPLWHGRIWKPYYLLDSCKLWLQVLEDKLEIFHLFQKSLKDVERYGLLKLNIKFTPYTLAIPMASNEYAQKSK